jgi:hypothetical protein
LIQRLEGSGLELRSYGFWMLASPINGEREQPGGAVFRVRLG